MTDRSLDLAALLGPSGPAIAAAMRAGLDFLHAHDTPALLARTGQVVETVPRFDPLLKTALPDSFGGNQAGVPDDFLVGQGLFYVGEQRRLFLDCTSGHYQMLWGYNPPVLTAAIAEANRAGLVWDNHSNIPQAPVKRLAQRLIQLGNAPGEPDPLETVLLGVCTGSVACGAALKIMLKVHAQRQGSGGSPVIVVLGGNYHGTDLVPQFLRGMWPGLVLNLEVVSLEPNRADALEAAFRQYGSRIAGFWAEPVMMNREAIAVDREYLHLVRACCDAVGALLCVDEIQTGFWQPKVFAYRELDLRPDLVVVGKGMTAGFHPLSGVLMRKRYDVLEQYDAISTNGSASLPSFVALASLALLEAQAAQIRAMGQRIERGFHALVSEFPERLSSVQGRGHLSGLKFHAVAEALAFQKRLLKAGLWTRAHAYHAGHSTLLTKLGLAADATVVDFMVNKFRELLARPA